MRGNKEARRGQSKIKKKQKKGNKERRVRK